MSSAARWKGLEVHVDAGSFRAVDTRAIQHAVLLALESAGEGGPPSSAEISVALVDDPAISALNARFLAKEGPTDVLAFSLGDAPDVVGDVYVGFEQASRQAADLGISLAEELVRLAIHGTLHVLGHDHPDGHERDDSPMFALQERLVREAMRTSSAG
ncbi:MAG: rRNA maturation RNase YbeY [Gemmatimonadales bacterium]